MAEKFSKFRDPGTGIQVFLTPVVASPSSSTLASVLLPVFAVLGVVRALVGGVCWALYVLFGWAGFLRGVLFALGFVRLGVEEVSSSSRRRGAASKGELVVANHSSWIDLLVLAWVYPGLRFVVPVIEQSAAATPSEAAKKRGAPKANAMSANTRIVTPASTASTAAPAIVGYTLLTLPAALRFVGNLPPTRALLPSSTRILPTLAAALSSSSQALAFFPELVTSNNRALLHITTLPASAPTTAKCNVMTLKYSAPTQTSVSAVYTVGQPTHSIAAHLARILFASSPVRGVSVKRTDVSALDSEAWGEHVVAVMSGMARLKQTSIAWWSKREFLAMVSARSKRA
ncbi:uncharacterized protein SRS1_14603 [Sporisorium reilianum f. sp. reilianum]|uniref:Phospholipid/glycerol acyltransferase domain-containing protein n=1 Tax=Sporisorium reilianum f. sp. reilianum TaxID=72559 RepID=A0A2N8UGE5_9BASI|nr:uncharacterized protein SRS1_14603 [Sporisorium reilianum f. sp. reilianum]